MVNTERVRHPHPAATGEEYNLIGRTNVPMVDAIKGWHGRCMR